MKNILWILFMGLMVISCSTTKEVEEKPTAKVVKTKPTTMHKRGGLDGEQMAAQLGLSEDQEDEFIEMWDSTTEAMKAVRREHKGDSAALIEGMTAVRNQRVEAVESMLTKEQLEKYYEIMTANKGKVRGPLHKRKG